MSFISHMQGSIHRKNLKYNIIHMQQSVISIKENMQNKHIFEFFNMGNSRGFLVGYQLCME